MSKELQRGAAFSAIFVGGFFLALFYIPVIGWIFSALVGIKISAQLLSTGRFKEFFKALPFALVGGGIAPGWWIFPGWAMIPVIIVTGYCIYKTMDIANQADEAAKRDIEALQKSNAEAAAEQPSA